MLCTCTYLSKEKGPYKICLIADSKQNLQFTNINMLITVVCLHDSSAPSLHAGKT